MVRDATYRQKKYNAKIDPDVIRSRFTKLKDTMTEQTSVRFSDLVSIEEQTKEICHNNGIVSMFIPAYLNVARELYKKSTKFSGSTLEKEMCIIRAKWISRGLDAGTIDAIIQLFGLDPSVCTSTSSA